MSHSLLFVICVVAFTPCMAQESEEALLASSKPNIQQQIRKIYGLSPDTAGDDLTTNCKRFEELQRLQNLTNNKGEIVKQLAIFVATTQSEENSHIMAAEAIREYLHLPASVPIHVLAPYIDANNEQLREFALGWFYSHDGHGRAHVRSPLDSANYQDYMEYVSNKFSKNEKVPTAFIEYTYEGNPGKALLVFTYAMGRRDDRSEIELSERIINHAIWLNENGFADRFPQALPEAQQQLEKLAEHDQWWARLYVAEIMRRHRELRDPNVLDKLRKDDNELASKAARSIRQ